MKRFHHNHCHKIIIIIIDYHHYICHKIEEALQQMKRFFHNYRHKNIIIIFDYDHYLCYKIKETLQQMSLQLPSSSFRSTSFSFIFTLSVDLLLQFHKMGSEICACDIHVRIDNQQKVRRSLLDERRWIDLNQNRSLLDE